MFGNSYDVVMTTIAFARGGAGGQGSYAGRGSHGSRGGGFKIGHGVGRNSRVGSINSPLPRARVGRDGVYRHPKDYCFTCPRDSRMRIARSQGALKIFKALNPKPAGCKPCIIDHIVPLYKGGADEPENLQWQTVEQAKAKDRVE